MKCRDCWAFGHTSRSKRCPIKCGYGLLVPQPLKAREEKENQDPHRAQGLQTPGTISRTERDKKLSQHPALHKQRQMPNVSFWAPGKNPPRSPTQPRPNPQKKPRLASWETTEESKAKTVCKASSPETQLQATAKRLGRQEAPEGSKNFSAQVPGTGQKRSTEGRAAPVSARPCVESRKPSAAHVAGQPLRMVFTRIQGDWWTSRFATVTPAPSSDKQTPPSESPASQEKGHGANSGVPRSVLEEDLQVSSTSEDSDEEGAHSRVPWSVLYEDLQVSSTSEDSDGEGDTAC